MAYQFVSEDPTPAQNRFESATQVTDYKTQKIYDSDARKELFLGSSPLPCMVATDLQWAERQSACFKPDLVVRKRVIKSDLKFLCFAATGFCTL
jgi:hypothetical protein